MGRTSEADGERTGAITAEPYKPSITWRQAISKLGLWQATIAATVLAALLLSAAWQSREPITVDIGNTSGNIDALYVEDFYAPETNPQATYRWAGPGASVRFYGVGHADWQVTARIASARTTQQGPLSVALSEGGGKSPFATINNVAQDFTSYTFSKADLFAPNGNVQLEIAVSSVLTSTDDPRAKGVAVDQITLQPQGFVLPPIIGLLALAFAVGAVTMAAALVAGASVALAVGATLGLVFAWLIGWYRLWLTPFTGQIFLIAIVFVAGVALIKAILLRYAPARGGAMH